MDLQASFTQPLLAWFDQHGRTNLPWQQEKTAYRVWIAEIMLQQTQVQTVIPYYQRFMDAFPNLEALYAGGIDAVLSLWSGLGYYSRARYLYNSACILYEKHQGCFPQQLSVLCTLPGIGPSTAAAILSQAFNQPTAILDSNVQRVLSRFFMIQGELQQQHTKKQLWTLAQACMCTQRCADYTQAIMDLGATCCLPAQPQCERCPLQTNCLAYCHNQVSLFPTKKKKKPIPQKTQQFIVLFQDKTIFLHKRPPEGIWGGLWCLPGFAENEDIHEALKNQYGFETNSKQHLIDLNHTFTHFKLKIHAYTTRLQGIKNEKIGAWFSFEQLEGLGLAKPIRDIIKYFYRENSLLE